MGKSATMAVLVYGQSHRYHSRLECIRPDRREVATVADVALAEAADKVPCECVRAQPAGYFPTLTPEAWEVQ